MAVSHDTSPPDTGPHDTGPAGAQGPSFAGWPVATTLRVAFGVQVALCVALAFVVLTYFIGTRLLPEPQTRADHGELLRTIGFSSAPGLIRVAGIIPGLGAIVFSLAGIWMLVATVIAVRQALDYTSTGRAIGVCAIGWVVQALILGFVFAILGAG